MLISDVNEFVDHNHLPFSLMFLRAYDNENITKTSVNNLYENDTMIAVSVERRVIK